MFEQGGLHQHDDGRQAEADQDQSRGLYSVLLERVYDAGVMDEETSLVWFSKQVEKTTGQSHDTDADEVRNHSHY